MHEYPPDFNVDSSKDALGELFSAPLPEGVVNTTPRFSLLRAGFNQDKAHDLYISPEDNSFKSKVEATTHGFNRFLVIDKSVMDNQTYDLLAKKNVPQLPRIDEVGRKDGSSVVFGVKDGLKPLVNEAFYAQPSTDTYISDAEIFTQLGRLYRKAWDATGKLILDPGVEGDSPLKHVAIHSFSDSGTILYLCPPYSPNIEVIEDLERAEADFNSALEHGLVGQLTPTDDQEHTSYVRSLLEQASQGFRGN